MEDKLSYNVKFANYYYKLYLDDKQEKYFNLSNNVKQCLSYWNWDLYELNKILDLKKVNRCKNRFCSNCRKWELSRALRNLEPHFKKLVNDGFYPFMLTLTVPNCQGSDISFVLDKMQKSFRKFYHWMSMDDKRKYSNRLVKFSAAIRCIEITYNSNSNSYHPHYHCLVFVHSDYYNPVIFDKKYKGEWSNKRNSNNMYSDIDMQVRKLWTLAYNGRSLRYFDRQDDIYIADIREMSDTGIFEVMKYVFKDTDISNFYVFRNFYFGLYNKRIRQGYGLLFNVNVDGDSDGKEQLLSDYIHIKESPSQLVTTEIKTLYTRYDKYIKLSRFNKDVFISDLD
jgi:plasmid rolling circle replication initiator protein Rep